MRRYIGSGQPRTTAATDARRRAAGMSPLAGRGLALLAVLALSVGLGCQGRQRTTTSLDLQPASQRLAEAQRLALAAQQAQKAGDHARAMELYQESLRNSQELHAVWNNMGLLLMEQNNNMDAVEMFRTAADLAPYDPQPFYNAGMVYDKAGHAQRAMEFYDRALERDPRYLPALRAYVRAAKLLDRADPATLARVRAALMVDHDPAWRRIHEIEQYRIEAAIRDQRDAARSRAVSGS
jgi:tetratricopeptide (TPR) repeat protein